MVHSVKVTRIREQDFEGVDEPEPPPNRLTVLNIEFPSTYKTDYAWHWDPDLQYDSVNMEQEFTTLNGANAIAVTWLPGSDFNDRWGSRITLPDIGGFPNGYSECWLTCDYKFVSPFNTPRGMKLAGIQAIGGAPSLGENGLSYRTMLSRMDSDLTSDRKAHQYYFVTNDSDHKNEWDSAAQVIALDTVARIEIYFKQNTAFNAADGILEARYDEGTSSTHATPSTLRAQLTNIQTYQGSEANRNAGKVKWMQNWHFFGGNTAEWNVSEPSQVIIGGLKIEIPNDLVDS